MHAHDSRSSAPDNDSRKPDHRGSSSRRGPAALHLQNTVGNAAAVRFYTERRRDAPGPVVQRTVAMHLTGGPAMDLVSMVHGTPNRDSLYEHVKRMAFQEGNVQNALTDEEKAGYEQQETTVKAQLEKWALGNPRSYRDNTEGASKAHRSFGSKTQDRNYHDYTSLVRGLLGWIGGKQGRRRERRMAEEVQQNPEIDLGLEIALERIRRFVEGNDPNQRDAIIRELTTSRSDVPDSKGDDWYGHYQKYFDREIQGMAEIPLEIRAELRTGINRNMWRVLTDPERYGQRDKLVVLHDLMEYFGPQRHWNAPTQGTDIFDEAEAGRELSTTEVGDDNRRSDSSEDRGQAPGHPSTRNENAPSTRLARERGIPVWSGSSFTAMRMLDMVGQLGGCEEEISAVAFGIFAFWRLDYDHGAKLAPHTLHEVLDIASNFDLDYDLQNPGAELEEKNSKGTLRATLRSSAADLTDILEKELSAAKSIQELLREALMNAAGADIPTGVGAVGNRLAEVIRRVQGLMSRPGEIEAAFQAGEESDPGYRKQLREFILLFEDLGQEVGELSMKIEQLSREKDSLLATMARRQPAR